VVTSERAKRSNWIFSAIAAFPITCALFLTTPLFLPAPIVEALDKWQQAIGGLLGLWGVVLVALWTFHDNADRDMNVRRRRNAALTIVLREDATRLLEVLTRGKCAIQKVMDIYPSFSVADRPVVTRAHAIQALSALPTNVLGVYDALLDELGELGPAVARHTARFYGAVANIEVATVSFQRGLGHTAQESGSNLNLEQLELLGSLLAEASAGGEKLLACLGDEGRASSATAGAGQDRSPMAKSAVPESPATIWTD
jgi:hypothetical protein